MAARVQGIGCGALVLAWVASGCSGGGGDAPPIAVGFAAGSSEVVEGQAPAIELVLTAPGGPLGEEVAVTVVDAGAGSATAGEDYQLDGATVVFPAGSESGTALAVPLAVLDDLRIEPADETLVLRIQSATGAGLQGPTEHTLTLRESRAATIQFSTDSSATADESAAAYTVQVELGLDPGVTLELDVSASITDLTSGTATVGVDYADFADQVVSFPAGTAAGATATVEVTVQPDSDMEGNETVQLGLVQPSARVVLDGSSEHTLTILDDELTQTPTIFVMADTGVDFSLIDSGDTLDLGSQPDGAGPTAGIPLAIENHSAVPIALSVLNLSGDVGDFALELEDPTTGGLPAEALPEQASFPLVARDDEPLQGVALELDETRLAALRGMRRIVLDDVLAPGGARLPLELERLPSPWRADAVLAVDGLRVPVRDVLSETSLWRGRVIGLEDSQAFLAFSRHGSRGWVKLPDGELLHLVSERDAAPGARRPAARLTWNHSLEWQHAGPVAFQCAGELLPGDLPALPAPADPPTAEGGESLGLTVADCRLAIETDYQLFQVFGSVQATVDYVTQLVAAIGAQYREDAQATLSIAYLGVYSDANDPWTTPDGNGGTSEMLDEFRDAWIASGWPAEADLAHFISGANLGGGIAYVGVLCSQSFGFGVSANMHGGIDWPGFDGSPSPLNWDFVVVAHELGHNFGASHTHNYCPPLDHCYGNCDGPETCSQGTIMSYCHLCGGMSNLQLEFHPHIATMMRGNVQASCLGMAALEPAASAPFRVRFEPTTGAGPKSATLRFTHDAENAPSPFLIHLSGTATN